MDEGEAGGLAGRTLGAYRVIERVRAGAVTETYRAEDTRLGREVAIVALRSEAARDLGAVERFAEAARRMGSLDHGNVARVLGFGEAEGRPYLATSLMTETLRERLAREGIPPVAETTRIVIQVAAGLHAAHAHGFVHGNLTPDCILFDDTGRVVVADFAMPGAPGAQATRDEGSGNPARRDAPYRAPELLEGAPASPKTDLYALGAVLYELLTGAAPEVGSADAASEGALARVAAPSTRNPLVWAALDAVALRALATNPEARFADARLLAQALRATVLVHLSATKEMEAAPPVSAPKATFDAPGAILPTQEEMERLRGARTMDRRVLGGIAALALVALLVCAGSGFAILGGFHLPGGGGFQATNDGGSVSATQGGGPQLTQATPTATSIPTATPLPTATPIIRPTSTPTPTQPPASGGLTFMPSPVQFQKKNGGGFCSASQTIRNTGFVSMSWAWTGGSLPQGFAWKVTGGQWTVVGYPKGGPIPSGGGSTVLSMMAKCSSSSYAVTVTDSQAGSYSISLVVP